MVKVNKIVVLLSTLFFAVSCGDNPSEVPPPPSGDPILESISLSGNYETNFYDTDTFTYKGLIVTAYYDDSSSKTVEGYSVSTPDMSILGEQIVTVTYLSKNATYTINIAKDSGDEVEGYIQLNTYYEEIDIVKNPKKTILLEPRVIVNGERDDTKTIFNCVADVDGLVKVKPATGTITPLNDYDGYQNTGTVVVTVTCEEAPGLIAKCKVVLDRNIPERVKVWTRVDDYSSLKDKDVLVIASPKHGVTASIDVTHSKLDPVNSTFSSDMKTITTLGADTAEFVLGFENKGMTLEATKAGGYLVCTHQGKVKFDYSNSMNRYWDIHSNIDPETGEGSIEDGAVIENNVASLGYIMFNITLRYFTTYVENSISEYMALPFLYRLQELN